MTASVAAFLAATLALSAAQAASPQTTPVTVGAIVSASCQVTTAPTLNFGNYNVFSASSTPGQLNLSITCSAGSSITVALSVGSNSASFSPRTLKDSSGNTLTYNLYTASVTNAGCTGGTVWGDGSGSTTTATQVASSRFTPVPLTVYGCIPSGQDVVGGPTETYTDVITVTVSFL